MYRFSEYLKIFDGNGTLEYHQSGCSPSNHGSLVEVPFLTSNNITAIIYLIRLRSSAIVQYVVLGKSLKSGICLLAFLGEIFLLERTKQL